MFSAIGWAIRALAPRVGGLRWRPPLSGPLGAGVLLLGGLLLVQGVGDSASVPLREPGPLRPVSLAEEAPARRREPVPAKLAESPRDHAWIFGGLGAWVDLYDVRATEPRTAVRTMKAHGVRTLFLQTGRLQTGRTVSAAAGPWLHAARQAGLAVVGWVLPGYGDVARDVARVVAIAGYEYKGSRFDGVAVDIEWRREVPDRRDWNDRVLRHLRAVRAAIGADVPLGAITPSPLQMRVAPRYWAGFPWRGVAGSSDAVLTMSYWSERSGCPKVRVHCAYEHTLTDVRLARRLTGGDTPVHVIGGVADRIGEGDAADFARAALAVNADGASLYDARTTRGSVWGILRVLRSLGDGPPA